MRWGGGSFQEFAEGGTIQNAFWEEWVLLVVVAVLVVVVLVVVAVLVAVVAVEEEYP